MLDFKIKIKHNINKTEKIKSARVLKASQPKKKNSKQRIDKADFKKELSEHLRGIKSKHDVIRNDDEEEKKAQLQNDNIDGIITHEQDENDGQVPD